MGRALAALAVLLCASTARAEPTIHHQAPDGCPDESAFRAALEARSDLAASTDELSVAIRAEGAGWVGELTMAAGEAPVVRQLSAATCEDLTAALALVAAILLEQGAAPEPAPTDRAPEAQPRPPPIARPAGATPARLELDVRATVERRQTFELGVGAGVAVAARGGPIALELPVFAEVAYGAGSATAVALRVGFRRSNAERDAAMGGADLTWTVARADLCALGWPRRAAARLWLCALAEGGTIAARAHAIEDARDESRVHLAGGFGVRLEVSLARLRIGIGASASAPLVRHRFYFAPDSTLFEQAPVEAETGLTLGWQFL